MEIFSQREQDGNSMELHKSSENLDDEYSPIANPRSVDPASGVVATLYGNEDYEAEPALAHMTINGVVDRLGFEDKTSSVEVIGGMNSCTATFYQDPLQNPNDPRDNNHYVICNPQCECWNENGDSDIDDVSDRKFGTCDRLKTVNVPNTDPLGNDNFGNAISAVDIEDGCTVTLYKDQDQSGLEANLVGLALGANSPTANELASVKILEGGN
jgi:hypothetical protein